MSVYNVIHRGVLSTIVVVEMQQVIHILSVWLQPKLSSMQSACAILSSVACLTLQYFSMLSHERHDFLGRNVFWLSLQLLSETFFILRRNQRHINVLRSLRAVDQKHLGSSKTWC
jgi:hypothetical protein